MEAAVVESVFRVLQLDCVASLGRAHATPDANPKHQTTKPNILKLMWMCHTARSDMLICLVCLHP